MAHICLFENFTTEKQLIDPKIYADFAYTLPHPWLNYSETRPIHTFCPVWIRKNEQQEKKTDVKQHHWVSWSVQE